MKFLCLTDYHGASELLPALSAMIQAEDPDIIFYCGGSMKGEKRLAEYEAARRFHSKPDIENPEIQQEIIQDTEYLKQFLLALADTQKLIYAIPGNNDSPESLYFKTIYNYAHIYPNLLPAHEMMHREDQFMVGGFGGGMTISDDNREFILQYSQMWVEFAMRRLEFFPGEKILMFYTPPVSRLDSSDGEHKGVLYLNELIEKIAPKLVMCGMAKSGQGVVKLGPSVLVNPGPLFEGHYALIDYPTLNVQFKNLKSL